jgi:hypothetical protein
MQLSDGRQSKARRQQRPAEKSRFLYVRHVFSSFDLRLI